MKIFWLECFVKVASLQNFSESADELYISQSVLSKNIKSLEEEIGGSLFDRTTRTVTLTQLGKSILPNAKSIIAEYQNITYKAHQSRERNEINIITCPVMHSYGLANMIGAFKAQNPDIILQISEAEMLVAQKRIKKENVDIAIVREPIAISANKDKQFKIIDDELALLCNINHPLAKKDSVSVAEIRPQELMVLENGCNEYRGALQELGYADLIGDDAVTTLSSSRTVQFYASQNWGVALISRYMANRLKAEDESLMVQSIKERPSFSLYMVALNETISPKEIKLIDFAREYLKR